MIQVNLKDSVVIYRSSHHGCSIQKGVLRNFTKFTGKHLCQISVLINLQASPATLLKKRLWRKCFPVNFVKFLRTPFLQNNSGRLLLYITHDKWIFEEEFTFVISQNPEAATQRCS